MPDKKIFCSSPWLHIKIGYGGQYVPCRWQHKWDPAIDNMNLKDTSIVEFFNSDRMNDFRHRILGPEPLTECTSCNYEDSLGKVSGRVKQLFRSKLDNPDSFDQSYPQSPHYDMFKYSEDNNGQSDSYPYDLQINLSDTCNSACIMCAPRLSSRLFQDYKKLSKISPVFSYGQPEKCWADDPILLANFIKYLKELPSIDYLHLLGGETLYLDSFYTICDSLIDAGLSEKIFLGTTTNLTIYSERLEDIIPKFGKFHIGLSIESVNHLNNYIRYPSEINSALGILDKFLKLRERLPDKIHLSLRITPNIFSIFYIDEVIQYMCDHNITGESCNILHNPACLRMELLPDNLRLAIIGKLNRVIDKNSLESFNAVDARNPDLVRQVIASVAYTYVDLMENMVYPEDGEQLRYDLITFLNGFESLRNNSILDYAPEYETFLTAYGYTHK